MTTHRIGLSALKQVWILVVVCGCVFAAFTQDAPPPATDFQPLATAAAAAREAGKTDEAIRDYQGAVQARPDWAEGWWYLGTLRYEEKHFAEARPSFQKVVELLPGMGAAWNFLGLSEFETQDYANSRTHLEKGQALGGADDPEIARVATYHLGLLRIKAGEFDAASTLLAASFTEAQIPEQVRNALGLAMLRVPFLPMEIDPSQDALLHAAGEAAALMAKGDAFKSIESLAALAKSYPNTPFVHYALGRALASGGRLEDALQQQRMETKISPESALPLAEISSLEARLRRTDAARQASAKAAQLAPKAPEVNAALARLYANRFGRNATAGESDGAGWRDAMVEYTSNRFPETIAALKAWLQGKPNDGTAWAVLGLSEFEMKDYDNALIHLQRGRELGFGGTAESVQQANYRLAMLLNRSGQFERASALEASTTMTTGPLAKEVKFVMGMTLLRIPLFPEQVADERRSIVDKAGETAGLLQSSQYEQAFTNFQAMLKQAPDMPFVHYAYGTALIAISRFEEAETEMRTELKISPKSELPYVRLASIALRQRRPADVLAPAQEALKLAPGSAEAHYLLGRAALEMGQIENAVRELESASKISPKSAEIHFNLAKAYARAKLPEKAEAERAIFKELNEAAEQQRSHTGNQAYEGPREATDLPTVDAAPR
jgi:tetratricopeptide (TPR) repeat protein